MADQVVPFSNPAGRELFWHSASHLMAQAVKELWPGAFLTIGPAVDDGFYYDVDFPAPITEADLPRIEARMHEIVDRDSPIVRREMPKSEALEFFRARGDTYKVEILNEIPDATVSLYEQGGFVDLCRGPHVPSTGALKAFKITSIAGAYWRGDEHNKMLTRLYGVAFPTQAQLDEHLKLLEEAKKRDHRVLGRDLDLFSFHEEMGPGLPVLHPKGAIIRRVIEDFWREEHARNGYETIFSPHIGKATLWETSGHLGFYKDSMYAPLEIEGQKYYLKPMNCPFHMLAYNNRQHSYRELPIRYCELGTVYRYERSGVLHGLLRVRGFTQDDAHIFMRPDQVDAEVTQVLKFVLFMLRTFGFAEFDVYLSTRPEGRVGTEAMWDTAEGVLLHALDEARKAGLISSFTEDKGGGVFYGPKIDVKVKDALGHAWQCSTIQVDFNLPERFDLTYIAEDGSKQRLVMVHRALLGSIDRFMGALIEHYAGAFPLWLAPVQARVLTITSDLEAYGRGIVDQLKAAGIRAEGNYSPEKIGHKIRAAELEKVPYMLVVGKREAADGKVAVRKKGKGDEGVAVVADVVARLAGEARERR
ncbi:MAG: threonine--tRNA ligase [Candidatus Coatesbacteria bacterium]